MFVFLLTFQTVFKEVLPPEPMPTATPTPSPPPPKHYLHIGNETLCKTTLEKKLLEEEIPMPTEEEKGDCLIFDGTPIEFTDFKDEKDLVVVLLSKGIILNPESSMEGLIIKGKTVERIDADIQSIPSNGATLIDLDATVASASVELTIQNTSLTLSGGSTLSTLNVNIVETSEDAFPLSCSVPVLNLIGIGDNIKVTLELDENLKAVTSLTAKNIDVTINNPSAAGNTGVSEEPLENHVFHDVVLTDADVHFAENMNVASITIMKTGDFVLSSIPPLETKNYAQASFTIGSVDGAIAVQGDLVLEKCTFIVNSDLKGDGTFKVKSGAIIKLSGEGSGLFYNYDDCDYFIIEKTEPTVAGYPVEAEFCIGFQKFEINSSIETGAATLYSLRFKDGLAEKNITIIKPGIALFAGANEFNFSGENILKCIYYTEKKYTVYEEDGASLAAAFECQIEEEAVTVTIFDGDHLKKGQESSTYTYTDTSVCIGKTLSVYKEDKLEGTLIVTVNFYHTIMPEITAGESVEIDIANTDVLISETESIPKNVTIYRGYYLYVADQKAIFKKANVRGTPAQISDFTFQMTSYPLEGDYLFSSELGDVTITLAGYPNVDACNMRIKVEQSNFILTGVHRLQPQTKSYIDFINWLADYSQNLNERSIYIEEDNVKSLEVFSLSDEKEFSIDSNNYERIYMVNANLHLIDQTISAKAFYYVGNMPIINESAKLTVNNLFIPSFTEVGSALPTNLQITDSIHTALEVLPDLLESSKEKLFGIKHLYMTIGEETTVEIKVTKDGVQIGGSSGPQIKNGEFEGELHLEFAKMGVDDAVTLKIIDATDEAITSEDTGKNPGAVAQVNPFTIDIICDTANNKKIVFDLSESNQKNLFNAPISIALPEGTEIKTEYLLDKTGQPTEDKPDYFEIKQVDQRAEDEIEKEPDQPTTETPAKQDTSDPTTIPSGGGGLPVGAIVGIVIACVVVVVVIIVVVVVVVKKKKDDNDVNP